ncbi:thioredoxin-like protein 1 isoform X1 [Hemicordylus capensis]|uniref:thioredoxin-like protein 1 isoform X1 n=1 Tax=Hemicordylus capensis TaxID=884348 RepID=UPI0023030C7C|nr:thioredoxin-like protein 1 isoform X1 [Hemicordylus capensis]
MVGVKVIANDAEFQSELSAASSRLVVAKFTMRGCGPCLRVSPAFNALSNKYPQATFLEVDVHQCQGTAATNNISATPTFLFFRNKVRIDQYQGADAVGLEEKIKQHLENDPGNNEDADIPKGYMDLMPFVNKAGCECLNESDENGFDNCLRKDSSYLESDCDEQLLITVAFNQPVKLYSMKFQGPENGQGPKYIKMFINLPRSMDFEEAERSEPTQALELSPDDIKEDSIIQLRYVKFQNVNSVTLFVQSNQGDEETTRIAYFTFIGTPVQATNMNDFKRVIHMGHLSISPSECTVLSTLTGSSSSKVSSRSLSQPYLEMLPGIEPGTFCMPSRCSTIELRP